MKIGVVGCGQVGSASAYACVLRGIGTELVLVDQNQKLATAQAEDILHATPFAKAMAVSAGDYESLHQAGIVMIAAGVSQKSGETRLDLMKRNAAILEEIIPKVQKAAPDAIFLIASNPVDIMTHIVATIAQKYGHPPSKVIGSGTILDTARFRTLLAQHLGVSSHSVHAHVLGEHGDSEVLNWSGANISNIPLTRFATQMGAEITTQVKTKIDDDVRKAAYKIIEGKGATWYGIGAGMARIAKAITEDEHAVLTCCAPINFDDVGDVTFSLPRIISAAGIVKEVYPVLDAGEKKSLTKSSEIIKSALSSIGY